MEAGDGQKWILKRFSIFHLNPGCCIPMRPPIAAVTSRGTTVALFHLVLVPAEHLCELCYTRIIYVTVEQEIEGLSLLQHLDRDPLITLVFWNFKCIRRWLLKWFLLGHLFNLFNVGN